MIIGLLLILLIIQHSNEQSLDLHVEAFDVKKISSDGKNTVTLDVIDNDTFDVQYQTDCQECRCLVFVSDTNLNRLSEITFKNKVKEQYVSGNRVYLIHTTNEEDVSYSILEGQANELKTIVKEAAIPSFKGSKYVNFNYNALAFVAYKDKNVIINKVDDKGSLKDTTFELQEGTTADHNSKVTDMVYDNDVLYLAKGDLGLDVITVKEGSTINRKTYSILDLELKANSQVEKLELNSDSKILYVYQRNSSNGLILALDVSNPNEISLSDKYNFGISNIFKVLSIQNQLHIVYSVDNQYYYLQSSPKLTEKYSSLSLQKLWKVPFNVLDIQRNGDQVLLETSNYLYLVKQNIVFETKTTKLLTNTIHKTISGSSLLLINQNLDYIVSVGSSAVTFSSTAQSEQKPAYKCGVFKQQYAGVNNFTVSAYKNTCPQLQNSQTSKVCLYRYKFEVDFTGTSNEAFKKDPTALEALPVSSWNKDADNGKITPPDQAVGSDDSSDITDPDLSSWTKTEDETKKDQDDDNDFPPLLIDPDAADYSNLNSDYAVLLVVIVSVIFFCCLIKCLYDFAKNSRNKLEDHIELQEEDDSIEIGKASGDVELVEDKKQYDV